MLRCLDGVSAFLSGRQQKHAALCAAAGSTAGSVVRGGSRTGNVMRGGSAADGKGSTMNRGTTTAKPGCPFPEGWVEKELKWWNIPGVAVGICSGDEILWSGGYGVRSLETGKPMTADTLGAIASCSKSFTASVIASLQDEGVIDIDAPVRSYLPEFELMDPFASDGCTLRDMLYHRTGLPPHDAMWPDPERDSLSFIRALRYLEPNRPFRSSSEYNNTVYAAAGRIAEMVCGRSWEELVRERIFGPLGMERSCTTMARMYEDENYASGYFARERQGSLEKMEPWEMDIAGPAAGVNSSVNEMLRYIMFHMNNGVFNGKRLLSEKMSQELHKGAVCMSAFPWRFPEVPGNGWYGMGWKNCTYRDMNICYHCGEIEGYCSMQLFVPGRNFGMFVICNRHKPVTPFLLELVYTAIDQRFDCPQADWAERLHPYENVFDGSCDDWKVDLTGGIARSDKSGQARRMSHLPEEYAGVYEHPGYGRLEVRREGEQLFLEYKKWSLPLEFLHYDTFIVRDLKEDTLYYTLPLTFCYDELSGSICAFTLRLEPLAQPVRFGRMCN